MHTHRIFKCAVLLSIKFHNPAPLVIFFRTLNTHFRSEPLPFLVCLCISNCGKQPLLLNLFHYFYLPDFGWHICSAKKRKLKRELKPAPKKKMSDFLQNSSAWPSLTPLSFQIKLSAGLPMPNWTAGNRRICLLLSPAGMCISP